MSKSIIWVIALIIMLLLGWAIKSYYYSEVPRQESPGTEPSVLTPPTENIREMKPAAPTAEGKASEEGLPGYERISVDKQVITTINPANLSDQNMSIKREEKQGFEIMPGVNVKSGGVHIKLDQDSTRSAEIKHKPPNSNNQYQLLLKQKF